MYKLKMIVFSFALAAMVSAAGGAIIGADSFEYATGNLAGQGSGGGDWGGAWSASAPADTGEITVVDGGLSYSAGGITISGGSKSVKMIDSTGGHQVMTRSLDAAETGSEYFIRFLMSPAAGTFESGDAAVVCLDTYRLVATRHDEGMVGMYGTTFAADVHVGTAGPLVYWGSTPTVGQTYLVMARFWKDPSGAYDGNTYGRYNTVEVWINPDTSDGVGTHDMVSAVALMSYPYADKIGGTDLWAWNMLDPGDEVLVDEYVIGTTWGEVIPEPATLALLAFGGMGLLIRRRRS